MPKRVHTRLDTANSISHLPMTSLETIPELANKRDSQVLIRQASLVSVPEHHSQLASSSFTENMVEGVFLDEQLVESTCAANPLDDSLAHHSGIRNQDESFNETSWPVRVSKHNDLQLPRREHAYTSYSNSNSGPSTILTHPSMNVSNYRLLQYRRMMTQHAAPHPSELQGTWRGINKGIATVAIDEQFVKRFYVEGGKIYGDNVSVHQLPHERLRQSGWQPIQDSSTAKRKRSGKFLVQDPQRFGPFRHGVVLNYRKGGNRKLDPTRLIEDKLVKLDDNHMLGRATAKFGPIKIPLSYFVIERIQD